MFLKPVQRSVEIKRVDSGRRVVYGEVMLAAPDMQDGDTVKASELEGRIHFDGAFMTQPEITELLDRFATKRPSIDVEHDGIPVGATVVESFQAREGDQEFSVGAWVVGLKIHDESVWARVEKDETDGDALRAFSIQFMVRVEEVNVTVVLDDGAEHPTTLFRFTNGDPQFLSLVKNPATGALWGRVDRSVQEILCGGDVTGRWTMLTKVVRFQDLPLAAIDRDYDREASVVRMFDADTDATLGFVIFDTEKEATDWSAYLPIGDVIDGELTAVPRAIFAAAAALQTAELSEAEITEARAHLASYYAKMRTAFADETIVEPWAGDAPAEGEAARSKKKWGASQIMALVRRGLGLERAEGDEDPEGVEPDDPEADADPVPRADVFGDYLDEGATSMRQGMEALLRTAAAIVDQSEGSDEDDTERMRSGLMDFSTWGSSVLDTEGLNAFLDGIVEADPAEETPPPEDDAPPAETTEDEDLARAVRGFADQMKAADFNEAIWRGTMTLSDTLFSILADDGEDAPTDKPAAMRAQVEEFAVWMNAKIDEMASAAALSAAKFDPNNDEVDRAGKKISGKRLKALKDLAAQLNDLIGDLEDAVKDSDDDKKRGEAATTSDNGGNAAEVDRSAKSGAAAQAIDAEKLLEAFTAMTTKQEALESRLRNVESARPSAAGAGGGQVEAPVATPYDKVKDVFFPSK